jgi:uncharacterized membrane protein
VQPVPSLVAIAASAALLAALARFDDRGIRWLGRPQGLELSLLTLKRKEQPVAALLGLGAATAGCWAAGLLAIDASYNAGQVIATALWALLGTAVVVLAIRARSVPFEAAGFVYVILALLKAAGFDWEHLGDGGAALSLLVAAGALLVTGFVIRWMDPADPGRLEIITLGAGTVATAAALVALGRWFGVDSRSLGIAAFGVAFVVVAVGVAPYRRWRRAVPEPWLRLLATGYWAIGLTVLLFAESQIVLRGEAGTFALWAATAGLLALTWRQLGEEGIWLAGLLVATATALGTLAGVAVPSRLVVASTHPATHLWALAVLVAAAWALALTTPPVTRRLAPWVRGAAAALTLYGLSLGVLELAERLSGASVATDFQRGHTALSTLWGIGALSLYVVGLARERRDLRIVGLTLLGLALAKLFLYDLSNLSSITRALSFLALGAVLLAAGFFAERFVTPGAGAAAADPPLGT